MAKANQKLKTSVARKRFRPESESEETSEESESPEDELMNDPNLPFKVVDPYGRTRVAMFGSILKAQEVQLWEKRKKDGSLNDENNIQSGYDVHASDEEPISKESGRSAGVLMKAARSIMEPVASKSSPENDEKQVLRNIQDTGDHSHNSRLPGSGNNPTKLATETETPEAASSSHNSKVIKPLFLSKPNAAVPRPTPGPSVELPVARQEDISTDDEDEIPQAPLMPLIIMADTKAKTSGILERNSPFIDRPKETPAKLNTTPSTKSQAGVNYSSQLIQPKGEIIHIRG